MRPEAQAGFEQIYGPHGVWAQLFSLDPAYGRTELQRDLRQPGRYLTFDYWTSESSYDRFHEIHRTAYEAIDRQCEDLTEREVLVGRFTLVP